MCRACHQMRHLPRLARWTPDAALGVSLLGRVVCISEGFVGVAFDDLDEAVWLPGSAVQAEPGPWRASVAKVVAA